MHFKIFNISFSLKLILLDESTLIPLTIYTSYEHFRTIKKSLTSFDHCRDLNLALSTGKIKKRHFSYVFVSRFKSLLKVVRNYDRLWNNYQSCASLTIRQNKTEGAYPLFLKGRLSVIPKKVWFLKRTIDCRVDRGEYWRLYFYIFFQSRWGNESNYRLPPKFRNSIVISNER